jgi:hypothetical protein
MLPLIEGAEHAVLLGVCLPKNLGFASASKKPARCVRARRKEVTGLRTSNRHQPETGIKDSVAREGRASKGVVSMAAR